MIKITKKIFTLLSLAIFFSFGASPAQAWYMELTNIGGTLTAGEYYTLDVYFQGDVTDNVETLFMAVRWNEGPATYAGITYNDYNRSEPPFDSYTLWNGEELPDSPPGSIYGNWTVPDNEIWNINGDSEPHFGGPLGIWKEGTSSICAIAPVPIPGAIFLLAPAFLGLIGLRRKKA